jgi:hypothetical protein
MPSYRKPTHKELAKSRDPRVAHALLVQQENYVNLLRQATTLLGDANPQSSGVIDQLIQAGLQDLNRLRQLSKGRIVSRKRPQNRLSGDTCCVYVDECGAHELRNQDPYRVFVLSAVIIRDSDFGEVDRAWKDFKTSALGSPDVIVHEPDVRKADGPFDNPHRRYKLAEMRRTFGSLPLTIVTVVVHRDEYLQDFGLGPVDNSLPAHIYWMALDFLMERVAMALDLQFQGATARVVAEARGLLQDTELQYEYARLLIQGTSYIWDGWFRRTFPPGVKFEPKTANSTGLQLADLVARPVGDKVINKRKNPYLWDEIRAKMCPLVETQNSILGLKIMPWRPRYKDLWK